MLYCAAQGNMADHVSDEKLLHVALKEAIPYYLTLLWREVVKNIVLKWGFQKML